MAKKQTEGYMSAKESRRISKENRKITNQFEKQRKRKNVPESEYLTAMHDPKNAVEFDNLHTYFFTDTGTVKSVDGVTFDVPIGKTVGVVGESGCGKSVTSLSLMQLIQRPQGQIVEGEIRLNLGDGKAYDIVRTPQQQMQHLRGNYVSMIFQEPMTSLNPVFRIGDQVDEVIALHDGENKSKAEVKKRTIELLEMVGIANSQGVLALLHQSVCQTDAGGGFALPGGGGVDGGDQNQFALSGGVFQAGDIQLCLILPVMLQQLAVDASLGRHLVNGKHGGSLCDFDVSFHIQHSFVSDDPALRGNTILPDQQKKCPPIRTDRPDGRHTRAILHVVLHFRQLYDRI